MSTPVVTPFPFADLPQYTRDDVLLQKRVSQQYAFLGDSNDLFAHFLKPLQSIMPAEFSLTLLQTRALRFAEAERQFSHKGLYALIRVLPQNKFAFLSFDPLLAKIMVNTALSGGRLPVDWALQRVQPMTALEEGIIEYLVVSCLESIEQQFQKKDFSFVFEAVMASEPKLNGYFSAQDEFVVFSFLVSHAKKDFHFQLVLPLGLAGIFTFNRLRDEFLEQRVQDFTKFRIDFALQTGKVELTAAEFEGLSVGDIILFDETGLKSTGDTFSGEADLLVDGLARGYTVKLTSKNENLIAEIKGVL